MRTRRCASKTRVPAAHRMARHHARHMHLRPAHYCKSHADAVPRIHNPNIYADAISLLQANHPHKPPDWNQAMRTAGNSMMSHTSSSRNARR